MDTAVELSFGDGKYRFWLPLPQALELERKCGAPAGDKPAVGKSLFTIFDQIAAGLGLMPDESAVYMGGGAAMITDVREVIRLGLIGGNHGVVDGVEVEVGPIRARELVEAYVYPARPLIEGQNAAWAILRAAISGIQVKKKAEGGEADNPGPSLKDR